MKHYYLNENAQPTGEHEVHTEGCIFLPEVKNRKYLGYFNNCKEAIKEAKTYYANVDGCFFCSLECHKK